MRSLIVIEVEHGNDTDDFAQTYADCLSEVQYNGLRVVDSVVRVDVPASMLLDSDIPSVEALHKANASTYPKE